MWLKCNLGKVNLEAMLVSSFPSYTRGGPMHLAGASRDLYTQLLCLQFFAKCCCNSLLFAYQFVLWFFPIPPSLLRYGPGKHWPVSIPLNCSVWRCRVGTTCRVAMETSSSCKTFAWLHQLCRHQHPSLSIGNEFNYWQLKNNNLSWLNKTVQNLKTKKA